MSKLHINLGDVPNDRTGDPLRTAFEKVNSNFDELYARTGDDIQIPALAGNTGKVLTTNGTTLSWGSGLSVSDFGEGFSLTGANKIVTNKLYSTNETNSAQHYRLTLDTNGVVILPDQSIINGATLKTVSGGWAGITAGPVGHDEDSWMYVDNDGAWIATKYSTDAFTWKFDNNGVLTFPGTGTITNPVVAGDPTGTIYTFANDGSATPGISSDNAVYLPSNINSVSIQPGWIITFADATQKTVVGANAGTGPDISKHILTFSGSVLKTGSEVWPLTVQSADYAAGTTTKSLELTPDGTTAWTFGGDGSLTLPNYSKQIDTNTVTCDAGADTVIYTSSGPSQMTIKLLLKIEGIEGVNGTEDTQSTEMIVAKGNRNNNVVASVYGLVYTSESPLATFTAQWNGMLDRIEVYCRPTSLSNAVEVKTFAVEIATSH